MSEYFDDGDLEETPSETEQREEKMKQYKTSGVLKGVEISHAPDKSWTRASLKIENAGKTSTVSTFEKEDIEKANLSNGMEIEATYTKSQKGDKVYNNLIKGGLKTIGQGEIPIVEEIVDDDAIDEPNKKPFNNEHDFIVVNKPSEAKVIITEKEGREMGKNPPNTQTLIVRQNSHTQANNYIANLLKAVEVGVLKEVEVNNTDLNLANLKKIAHEIEQDIMRN